MALDWLETAPAVVEATAEVVRGEGGKVLALMEEVGVEQAARGGCVEGVAVG